MNSITHSQTCDNSPFSTPSLPVPMYIVLHQLSKIFNPSTVYFERLRQQHAQFFFYLLDQQRNYPKSST